MVGVGAAAGLLTLCLANPRLNELDFIRLVERRTLNNAIVKCGCLASMIGMNDVMGRGRSEVGNGSQ